MYVTLNQLDNTRLVICSISCQPHHQVDSHQSIFSFIQTSFAQSLSEVKAAKLKVIIRSCNKREHDIARTEESL
jgi:hypothetical protein